MDPVRLIELKPILPAPRAESSGAASQELQPLLTREWLVTNGMGGYASGTIAGAPTRRYHGLLIASLATPHGRVMMLNHMAEQLKFPDKSRVDLGAEERGGMLQVYGAPYLVAFRLEFGMPVWQYRVGKILLEKTLFMPHGQNTTYLCYRLLEGDTVALRLTPAVHFRGHDDPVSTKIDPKYVITADGENYEITLRGSPYPGLRMKLYGQDASFTVFGRGLTEVFYRTEESRGYDHKGDLWSPGHFWVDLTPDQDATLVASTESWNTVMALSPDDADDSEMVRRRRLLACAHPAVREGLGAELVLGADQFIVTPAGRV